MTNGFYTSESVGKTTTLTSILLVSCGQNVKAWGRRSWTRGLLHIRGNLKGDLKFFWFYENHHLKASKIFLAHHISQTKALADCIRAFRLAGLEVVLCGDFNAYTIDHVGFTEKESEFHDTLPDECDWPIRRKSACTHPQRNQNGRELIELCQCCELVVVNGALVDGKFFDSGLDSGFEQGRRWLCDWLCAR